MLDKILITEDSVYVAFVNSKLRYLVPIRALMTPFYVKIRLTHCICKLHILHVGVFSANKLVLTFIVHQSNFT